MHAYQSVFFEPWIGSQYATTGLWDRKVLIVGESHYDEFHSDKANTGAGIVEPKQLLERTETKNCISEIINNEGGSTFWTKIRFRIGGAEHETGPAKNFWDKIAFYNFVQTPVSGRSRVRPTRQQFEKSVPAFYEVIENLRPDRVIVTGDKLSGYIPPRVGALGNVGDGEQSRPVEYFSLAGGHKSCVLMVSHPTSSSFPRILTPIVHEFIVRAWGA